MKKDYLSLWGLLAVAFVIFMGLSTCGDVSVGNMTIKSSSLADVLKTDSADNAPADTAVAVADAIAVGAEPSVAVADTAKLAVQQPAQVAVCDSAVKVLIIGDSMLEGLAPRLAAYCQASGYSLYSVIWYSSTSEIYANSHLLTRYIKDIKPDYIFLSLGGNELFVKDIIEKRDKCVKTILAEIGSIPYLWIGPPNWKPDTGINQLISQNVPDGCYFKSEGMKFDRKKDGAHPTAESAIVWMDSIMRWMPDHARYRLVTEVPVVRTARPTKQYMHKPGPNP